MQSKLTAMVLESKLSERAAALVMLLVDEGCSVFVGKFEGVNNPILHVMGPESVISVYRHMLGTTPEKCGARLLHVERN